MKKAIATSWCLFLLLFLPTLISAQTKMDTIQQVQKVTITMQNGDAFTGTIIQEDENSILLATENGEMNLLRSRIKSMENNTYQGEFPFANPHDTRYFFGPSGIPIPKGKGYYQNVYVTLNFVNYGITDNFSIGGGFEFISTILGSPVWFLTPKLGFEVTEKLHAGGGLLMGGLAGEGVATLAYGVVTSGTSESNISLGAGYGLVDGDFSRYPAIMLAGTHRVSRTIALLTENYLIPGDINDSFYFGIHGIRIMTKKSSFDIGILFIPQIADEIPALPYIGYVRVF